MRNNRGVSMLGFLSFLIVIGVLGYVYYPKFFGPTPAESAKKIKADFDAINAALDNYRLDNGSYPTTEQGLQALIEEPSIDPVPQFWKEGGYIKVMPQDPWGQPYQYTNNDNLMRIFSYGPGGRNGNTKIDASNVDQFAEGK